MVGIDPNNDSNYNFKHQSMTVDFDPFWTFKMFGDPLLHIGDPQNLSLVTPLVTKKKTWRALVAVTGSKNHDFHGAS